MIKFHRKRSRFGQIDIILSLGSPWVLSCISIFMSIVKISWKIKSDTSDSIKYWKRPRKIWKTSDLRRSVLRWTVYLHVRQRSRTQKTTFEFDPAYFTILLIVVARETDSAKTENASASHLIHLFCITKGRDNCIGIVARLYPFWILQSSKLLSWRSFLSNIWIRVKNFML